MQASSPLKSKFNQMKIGLISLFLLWILVPSYAQIPSSKLGSVSFAHPGLAQSLADMEYMKDRIQSGQEPWKSAFKQLQNQTSLTFVPRPVTHISVGAYGANSRGGRAFSESSKAAYNHALMWYITGDRRYAVKTMEILKVWSKVLWDFDDNNAKLNVGLDGPGFLYAAEILKHTDAHWGDADRQQFEQLVMTVFYPVIKDFFTEANGNWDASMIHTMLCIGIFMDDRSIFNRAVERFLHGPGNSGITKYIYPTGQIQETTRDWGHVQLGIGEFAKAAQVAWTQGVDFYSAADNRLASGFEYTAKFLLGGDIPVYGVLSTRERDEFRDIYESVYQHYHDVKHIAMPYTARVINEHTRKTSSVSVLTGIRKPTGGQAEAYRKLTLTAMIPATTRLVGAKEKPVEDPPNDAVYVKSGDAIQPVLDRYAGEGRWIVLDTGVYTLDAPLRIPSSITLAGQGKNTILILGPQVRGKTMVNATAVIRDVVIRDLLIEGATNAVANYDPNSERRTRSYMNAPSREGISFQADSLGQMENIKLLHITVQNFTKNGVTIRGARKVEVIDCDISDNGGSVVPGAGFHHNLHLTRIVGGQVTNNRMDTSPWGSGLDISFVSDFLIAHNEAARNKLSGITCTESRSIQLIGNLAEGNDLEGIALPVLYHGTEDVTIEDNILQYNGGHGIFAIDIDKRNITNNREVCNGAMVAR